MSVALAFADNETIAVVPFQGESQKAARSQNAARFLQNWKEIGDIDHRVGGEDEIYAGVRLCTLQHIGHFKLGIEIGGACLFDHTGRKVDADELIDHFSKGDRGQSCTAT